MTEIASLSSTSGIFPGICPNIIILSEAVQVRNAGDSESKDSWNLPDDSPEEREGGLPCPDKSAPCVDLEQTTP